MRSSDDPFGLRPLWNAGLEIYSEIVKICNRHGLRYYATDGTALGAVRHKGFIPWDDDIDISMPRPDYEKFRKIANAELPQHLRFWDYRDESHAIYLFGKVQDLREEKVSSIEKSLEFTLSNGLFVDVFPIDGYPTGFWDKWKITCVSSFMACVVRFRCTRFLSQTRRGRCAWILGFLLSAVFPWLNQRRCLAYCERLLRHYGFDESDYTGRACSSLNVFRRAPLKREVWGTGCAAEFDGRQIVVPCDVDAFLRNEYYKWDYRKLPPEKDRHPTHGLGCHYAWWLGPESCRGR